MRFSGLATLVIAGFGGSVLANEPPLRAWVDVPAPKKITAPQPRYPGLAREARVQATLLARITIATDGRLADVTFLRSVPLFEEETVKALRGWRYEPTVVDGVPRVVIVHEPFGFYLGKKIAQFVADEAARVHPTDDGAIEIKMWAVRTLEALLSTERDAAANGLKALASDPDQRVAEAAKQALEPPAPPKQ